MVRGPGQSSVSLNGERTVAASRHACFRAAAGAKIELPLDQGELKPGACPPDLHVNRAEARQLDLDPLADRKPSRGIADLLERRRAPTGPAGDLRVPGGVVQPAASPLLFGLPEPSYLREPGGMKSRAQRGMEAAESAEIAVAIARSPLENAARFPQLPHPRRRARLLRTTVHEIGGGPEPGFARDEKKGTSLVIRLARPALTREPDKQAGSFTTRVRAEKTGSSPSQPTVGLLGERRAKKASLSAPRRRANQENSARSSPVAREPRKPVSY
jgi:hypothetical protein